MAKIRMRRAGGENQKIIWHGHRAVGHRAREDIDGADLRHEHGQVLVVSKYRSYRPGDVTGRQRRSGHLVKQRLEQMEISPIDERDVHGAAAKRARGLQAAKPGSNEHCPGAKSCMHCEAALGNFSALVSPPSRLAPRATHRSTSPRSRFAWRTPCASSAIRRHR